jgi:Rieske Fe-S protein
MQGNPIPDAETDVPCCQSASAEPGGPATSGNTRRGLLAGAGLVGIAGVVAACGGSGDSSTTAPAGGSSSAPGGGATAGGGTGGGGAALAKTSDIPVGGGKIFADQKVVVTQPQKGTFKAFSAVCTHRGCTVDSLAGGTINCPCHGSKYKIADASVVAGPAPSPLPPKKITVEGDEIKLA